MCELLGMSANVPTDIVFSFTGLMERSGNTGPHKDGWGIAFYEGKACRTFHDPQPACDSAIANLVKNYPIQSHIVISHIRLANRGKINLANTHPFTRELWGSHISFAHNGQLKGIKKKSLRDFKPVGTTDSEYAFCWLLGEIKHAFPKRPSVSKLKKFIKHHCDELKTMGVFNMLLSDSRFLFAYCSTKLCWITRRAPFDLAKLIDTDLSVDFGTETTPNDVVSVVATSPLTENETWNQLESGELLCLSKGIRC